MVYNHQPQNKYSSYLDRNDDLVRVKSNEKLKN